MNKANLVSIDDAEGLREGKLIMGYTTVQFFIVHSWDHESVAQAREIAVGLFGSLVSPTMTSIVNDYDGFVVWTSGSKDGWTEADKHLANIEHLIEAMAKLDRPPRWTWASSGEEVGDLRIEHGYDGDYLHVYERAAAESGPVEPEEENEEEEEEDDEEDEEEDEEEAALEQLKRIDAGTPPGTKVLVVGMVSKKIYIGELVKSCGVRAAIRGRDGREHECFAYSVHVMPEVSRG